MAKRATETQKPRQKRDKTALSPGARADKVKMAIDKAFRLHRDALEELAARDSESLARPTKK